MIKKISNHNEYALTGQGKWVRNFTKRGRAVDITDLCDEKDYQLFIKNQINNMTMHIARVDVENIYCPNCVIVSDGYQFKNKQDLLAKLSNKGVIVIGVNRSLANWDIKGKMDYYITNNPYESCMSYLPTKNYYPKCIVSCRTYPDFIRKYMSRRGVVYQYFPTPSKKFSNYVINPMYYVDDYRNPICAAIGLAYHWEVRKLALVCCDDSFESERPGAEKLPNGLWMYPQHKISHDLIEGNLHWLKQQSIDVADHSSGGEYENASYIKENDLLDFF
jgi:hypothetical protein